MVWCLGMCLTNILYSGWEERKEKLENICGNVLSMLDLTRTGVFVYQRIDAVLEVHVELSNQLQFKRHILNNYIKKNSAAKLTC